MNTQVVFGLSVLLSVAACSLVAALYVWRPLRAVPRHRALRLLATLHVFRFVGLSFLVPGVVSPSLPSAFVVPAAYGDLGAVALAWASVTALSRDWTASVALVWLLNLWGTIDFLYAFYQGGAHIDPGMLGAAFFIPTVVVPPLFVDHILALLLLIKKPRREP